MHLKSLSVNEIVRMVFEEKSMMTSSFLVTKCVVVVVFDLVASVTEYELESHHQDDKDDYEVPVFEREARDKFFVIV